MTTPYYQDDLVTLYHGDCREVTEWMTADVLVTDPPYGIRVRSGRRGEERHHAAVIANDESVAVRDEALALWGDKPSLVFGTWQAPRPHATRMRLIWDKGYLFPGGVHPFRPCDEEIYVCGAWPNPHPTNRKGANVPGIIRVNAYAPAAKRPPHPTPKPPRLFAELLRHVPPGTVADPFAGSGPLLLAARDAHRPAIGVEIEEKYCELIASRLTEAAQAAPGLFGIPGAAA